MKSTAEIKAAHDFLARFLSGCHPIDFPKKDWRLLRAQYDVLCFCLDCFENNNFQDSLESLSDLLNKVHILEHGRKYRSKALVE